jgi:epoxyqueuosine reductase QueG
MLKELKISDLQFKEKYAASPILRAKRRGWIRNLCSVLVNLQIVESISPLENLLENENDPLILSSVTDALAKLRLSAR